MTARAAWVLLFALAGCDRAPTPAAPTSVAPASAAPVRAAAHIMSMNPCIDAILVRVADPDQIVSISHYSREPSASSIPMALARRFPANDGTAEEVVALRPDLVLLGPHVAPATQAAIRSVGVRIESFAVPDSIVQSRAQVLKIARAVGHPERGRALVAQIDAALAAARAPAGQTPVPTLIRMGGGLVPGSGTLADDLLGRTGFANMSASYGLTMWDVLPIERLIARPPRLLLTDGPRRDGPSALLARVPGMRIAEFPNRLLQCAGPNLIEAARRLAAIRRQRGPA